MADHDRLRDVHVPRPCRANWDEMVGDERQRYCPHCQRTVHNFSEMTAEEAGTLLDGSPSCIRYRLDTLGQLVLQDTRIRQMRILPHPSNSCNNPANFEMGETPTQADHPGFWLGQDPLSYAKTALGVPLPLKNKPDESD